MSDALKKVIPVYIILIIYVLLSSLLKCTSLEAFFLSFLNPLLLLLISVLSYHLTKECHLRVKKKNIKFKIVISTLICFLFIYIFLGLIFGFVEGSSFSIVIISLLLSALMKEFIRYRLILSSSKKSKFILLTCLFILLDIDFILLFNGFYNYIYIFLLPIILINVISTYLCLRVNLLSSIIFITLIIIVSFIPVLPDVSWVINFLLLLALGLVLFFSINRINLLDERKNSRYLRKENPLIGYGLIGFAIVFLMFIVGCFKYQPIAVLSNSMKDYYSRGDIVIVEKISSKEIENIQDDDILYYRYGNKYITHRVYDIKQKDGRYIFFTKGDNNDSVDPWEVSEDDIDGIVRMRIKYLGWPTVWVFELLS